MPTLIPMMLPWSDTLPTGHSIGTLFLIFYALISVQQYTLLLLQEDQVEVEDSCFRGPRFPCMVTIESHGKHCEFSMNLEASIDKLLVQVLHRFQTVLHVLVQSFCCIEFSNFWNPAILFAPFRMVWMCHVFFLLCGDELARALLPITSYFAISSILVGYFKLPISRRFIWLSLHKATIGT